jgi:hypothetical protein
MYDLTLRQNGHFNFKNQPKESSFMPHVFNQNKHPFNQCEHFFHVELLEKP